MEQRQRDWSERALRPVTPLTKPLLTQLATEKLIPWLYEREQPDATVRVGLNSGLPISVVHYLAELAEVADTVSIREISLTTFVMVLRTAHLFESWIL